MGGGAKIFELFAGEDIDGDEMNLGVTMLASLGGGHLDDFARAALDDDETVLPQGRTLHWVGGRRASIGTVERMLMLRPRIVSGSGRTTWIMGFQACRVVKHRTRIQSSRTCASSAMVGRYWRRLGDIRG